MSDYGSTVDHVLTILLNLGVITKSQIALIRDQYNGQPFQRKLFTHCAVFSHASVVGDKKSWILCRGYQSSKGKPPLYDIVRDQKIELTKGGARIAEFLAEKYKPTVSRETYLAEAKRGSHENK